MGTINLCNSKGRDGIVNTEAVSKTLKVRWLDAKNREVSRVRILRASIDHELESLTTAAGSLEKVGAALLAGDPEIDIETYGRFLGESTRVYVDPDKKIIHRVSEFEIVRNLDGSVRERRPRTPNLPNVATETPLKWSGKKMKKTDVFNRFVFVSKQQIIHTNGLTYDFLYAIAKELEAEQSLLLVGAGPKSNAPLIFQRGGTPYRGFLEGRTRGDKYCLLLHLSNLEMRAPEPLPEAAPVAENASPASPSPSLTPSPTLSPTAELIEPPAAPLAASASASANANANASAPESAADAKPKRTRKKAT